MQIAWSICAKSGKLMYIVSFPDFIFFIWTNFSHKSAVYSYTNDDTGGLAYAFVIPKERIKADEPIQSQEITDESIEAKAEAVITENSYKDDKISITISELREYDTSIYVADIQLAQIMKGQDCVTAYNLDGGGSSTMWFNGEVVNKPTSYGSKISERAVSDIVYIGR